MSCKYCEECPSRSNWCMGIDSGPFENCVEFLIKDYQNSKDISSCPHWDKTLGCYGCNYCGTQFALDLIFKTLVDDKENYPYLTTMSESTEQTNSIMLDLILRKYSKKYRKYCKKIEKERKRKENKKWVC